MADQESHGIVPDELSNAWSLELYCESSRCFRLVKTSHPSLAPLACSQNNHLTLIELSTSSEFKDKTGYMVSDHFTKCFSRGANLGPQSQCKARPTELCDASVKSNYSGSFIEAKGQRQRVGDSEAAVEVIPAHTACLVDICLHVQQDGSRRGN
ncbi:hypothetical protein RRG08_059758 [Elysia crispata]|uniref:Uncharacterized protein n=1 Tax=Elysia crispata TaxID=231223 RepID=A0AAE1BF04_9GAST|nr:hypothetical protein RRG08_059758 [Elysia crispata]